MGPLAVKMQTMGTTMMTRENRKRTKRGTTKEMTKVKAKGKTVMETRRRMTQRSKG